MLGNGFFTSQTPALPDVFETTPVTVGQAVSFSSAGKVYGGRFYGPATIGAGTYELVFYEVTSNSAGTLLANQAYGTITASVWNEITFSTAGPISVVTTKLYKIALRSSAGRYCATGAGMASAGITNLGVTSPQDGATFGALGAISNGSFASNSITAYPASTFNSNEYFVDVDFVADTALTVIVGIVGSAERWGSGTLSVGTGLTVPGVIQGGERFGSGALAGSSSISVVPGVVQSGERFGSALLTPVTAPTAPGVIQGGERFGSALLTPVTAPTVPGVIQGSEQFGSALLAGAGTVNITHASTPSSERWGSATVSVSAGVDQAIVPGVIPSAESFGSGTLSPGTSTTAPGTIGPTEQFGTGVLTAGSVAYVPGVIGPQERWGSATVAPISANTTPGVVTSQEQWGSATLAVGLGGVAPGVVNSSERWGSATLTGSPSVVSPGTIGSVERWGSASMLLNASVLIAPGVVLSGERWGSAYIEYGARTPTHIVKAGPQKFEVEIGPQQFAVRYNRKLYEVEME